MLSRLGSRHVINVQVVEASNSIAATVSSRAADFSVVFGCLPEGHNTAEEDSMCWAVSS